MMNIDTERVILEVQMHPVIWDTNFDLYKSKDARQAAWMDICTNLVENFDQMTSGKKKSVVVKLQQRWKTARDCYVKAKANKKKLKKPGSVTKKGKIYIYYDLLTFLDHNEFIRVKESDDSHEETISGSNEDNSYHFSQVSKSPSTIEYIRDISIDEQSQISQTSVTTTVSAVDKSRVGKKRKNTETDLDKELLCRFKKNYADVENEDWAFFHSIIPTIKKFNTYQKLIFRNKILNYLIETERENMFKYNLTAELRGRGLSS